MEENLTIRKFSLQDRAGLRRISCDTAFLGKERGKFFFDDEILADALTIYFTDYEPQSSFVAVASNRVVGYITGAKDARAMGRIFSQSILPGLIIKAFRRGVFFSRRNLRFFWYCLISLLRGEFRAPDFSSGFPAILHINLDKDFRGEGVGSQLIARYLQYLREEGISGVHLGTLSEGASIFFTKLGFSQLFKSRRSYLKSYIGKELEFYVFGKRL
ncbi:MAG TPA: GNAT family N-acetyltransferase [Candidatus Margulisiibacteriota bacterium]|nr:GNAT family N-acetyltransferase [Candidatus Margulisiibacteriota bacterium]